MYRVFSVFSLNRTRSEKLRSICTFVLQGSTFRCQIQPAHQPFLQGPCWHMHGTIQASKCKNVHAAAGCCCCCGMAGRRPRASVPVRASGDEGAVTPLHRTLWQVTVAVTVSCQRPHAPTATAIAGRCCRRRNISQRPFHGASRRHSASLLITLCHAVCQVPACAQKRLAAAELRCQQSCQGARCGSVG
jgi:hypothetical protein